MSSTNKTTNYNLSQFIGSDKPAWLVDYNGDMSAIDTQMKANADAANAAQTTANTADGKADTNALSISTLDSQINGASGLAADVNAVQGAVNTINSLIGNGEPTTTDKTLIGAINELNSDLSDKNGVVISQSNRVVEVTGDGVKTLPELLADAAAALDSVIDGLAQGEYVQVFRLDGTAIGSAEVAINLVLSDSSGSADFTFMSVVYDSTNTWTQTRVTRVVNSAAAYSHYARIADDGTATAGGYTTAVTSGHTVRIHYNLYKTI